MADERPIFILAVPRSGSTLLRLLLDSHPEVSSPPQTNLAAVLGMAERHLAHVLSVWPTEHRNQEMAAIARQLAAHTVGAYAARHGKQRWADRSFSSIDNVELLHRVFPEAQFVCLVRNVRDTVASLLEACPFDFAGYGLDAFIRMSPMSPLLAAARLWEDKVTKILECEDLMPECSHRIRYEDLAREPQLVLDDLYAFLGLSEDDDVSTRDFKSLTSRLGPGDDYKFRFTNGIHEKSVGRGSTLPLERHIPDDLDQRIAVLSGHLGYSSRRLVEPLPAPDRRRGRPYLLPNGIRVSVGEGSSGESDRSDVLARLDALFFERVRERVQQPGLGDGLDRATISLRVLEEPTPWLIDVGRRKVTRESQIASCEVYADARTLLAVAGGYCDPAVAVRHGRLMFRTRLSPMERTAVRLDACMDVLFALICPDGGGSVQTARSTTRDAFDPAGVS